MMRGYSLIEAIVSIFLLGLIAVALVSASQVAPLNRYAKDQDVALKIAVNELDSLRAGGYAALPGSGSFSSANLTSIPLGAGSLTISSYGTNISKVTATVSWQEPNYTSSSTVAVTTLVTKTGGL